jgi:hypothetical protein
MRQLTIAFAAILVLIRAGHVSAAILAGTTAPGTFSGGSDNLEASATFEIVAPGGLQVTLDNTSPADVLCPTDVLTAVFFDIVGDPALSPTSAVLGPDSHVLFGGGTAPGPGGVVGGEWAYLNGLSGAPYDARQGISSTGLDLFGPHDRFPGENLKASNCPNGLEYGITSAGDDGSTGNAPVTGKNALIQNEVVFVLEGLPAGFTLDDVSNVSFQYGTSLDLDIVPEPGSVMVWVLLAALGITAGCRGRRKRLVA